ncbi:MAG: cytochrome PufQ [Thermoanaerobaculia bacterium]
MRVAILAFVKATRLARIRHTRFATRSPFARAMRQARKVAPSVPSSLRFRARARRR